jgi:hypothetical protein
LLVGVPQFNVSLLVGGVELIGVLHQLNQTNESLDHRRIPVRQVGQKDLLSTKDKGQESSAFPAVVVELLLAGLVFEFGVQVADHDCEDAVLVTPLVVKIVLAVVNTALQGLIRTFRVTRHCDHCIEESQAEKFPR